MDRLKSLEVFKAVVEHKGFSKCGEALNMPKSVVTRFVQDLEAEMGARLLVRTTRRVTPTVLGQCVFDQASTLLSTYEEMASMCRRSDGEASGRVRVDMPALFGLQHFGPVLSAFMDGHPHIKVDLRMVEGDVDAFCDLADVAITVGPDVPEAFVARPLAPLPIGLYASRRFLQRTGELNHPAQLTPDDFMTLNHPAMIEAWLLIEGVSTNKFALSRQASFSTNHPTALVDAAIHSDGVTLVPWAAAELAHATGQLVPVLRKWWPRPLDVNLIYRSRSEPLRVRKLVEHILGNMSAVTDPMRVVSDARLEVVSPLSRTLVESGLRAA